MYSPFKIFIYYNIYCRSDDESDNEIGDDELNKILIVTQTPPSLRKHPQGDRTGDHVRRSKMTSEMTKIINDGLCYYEQDLWEKENEVMTLAVLFLQPSLHATQ